MKNEFLDTYEKVCVRCRLVNNEIIKSMENQWCAFLQKFSQKVRTLIDELKSVCANYGLGNDGNEFKIITQVFLYKFLHDKFIYEIKQIDHKLSEADDWEDKLAAYSKNEFV